MNWTMPRPVLHWVAGLMALGATAAFVMGVVNAPERGGRLPGERAARGGRPATAIDAAEATPLSQERIEAPPKPVAKATNTDQGDQADNSDEAVNATPPAKTADATKPPPTTVTPPTPPATPVPPPDDEPPH